MIHQHFVVSFLLFSMYLVDYSGYKSMENVFPDLSHTADLSSAEPLPWNVTAETENEFCCHVAVTSEKLEYELT